MLARPRPTELMRRSCVRPGVYLTFAVIAVLAAYQSSKAQEIQIFPVWGFRSRVWPRAFQVI
jgi:hypothetical protein